MPQAAGVVLAAGAGRRFGKPKALVEYHGRLLVERAATVLADGGCTPVFVVLGAAAEQVRQRARLPGATVITNTDWPTGMGSSLRAALEELTASEATAAMIMTVDMPGITAEAVHRVLAHAAPDALAAAAYEGQRGHPVLLGRAHWAGSAAASVGDAGARHYLREHDVTLVSCDDVATNVDIDRPGDLDRG